MRWNPSCADVPVTGRGDRRCAGGVDMRNPLEAAVSCSECQPRHAVALLSLRLANAPVPRIKVPWEDPYEKKKEPETPPPPDKQDDGN